jgi:hypothetical protein
MREKTKRLHAVGASGELVKAATLTDALRDLVETPVKSNKSTGANRTNGSLSENTSEDDDVSLVGDDISRLRRSASTETSLPIDEDAILIGLDPSRASPHGTSSELPTPPTTGSLAGSGATSKMGTDASRTAQQVRVSPCPSVHAKVRLYSTTIYACRLFFFTLVSHSNPSCASCDCCMTLLLRWTGGPSPGNRSCSCCK